MTTLIVTDERVREARLVLRKHDNCPECARRMAADAALPRRGPRRRRRCAPWIDAYDVVALAMVPAWDEAWNDEDMRGAKLLAAQDEGRASGS